MFSSLTFNKSSNNYTERKLKRKNYSFFYFEVNFIANCNFFFSAYVLYSYKFELLLKVSEENKY